jgi:ferredoxin--NADP+ reductase
MLAKTADDLHQTDVPHQVLEVLRSSAVSDIHLVGRRGAAQAKFTTKELRELGELANADVVVDPAELVLDESGQAAYDSDASVRRNVDVLTEWSSRAAAGRPRRIHVRFLLRPTALLGDDRVHAVQFERTRLNGTGGVTGTGETETIDAEMVLRSVGYRGVPIPGLPFDADSGTIPNDAGRVLRDGAPATGEYVAGWIKRGPTGVIGTNRSDAAETVRSLMEDVSTGTLDSRRTDPTDVVSWLTERGVPVVPWRGWLAIEQAEIDLGDEHGRPRVKLNDRTALLSAAETGATDVGGNGAGA